MGETVVLLVTFNYYGTEVMDFHRWEECRVRVRVDSSGVVK